MSFSLSLANPWHFRSVLRGPRHERRYDSHASISCALCDPDKNSRSLLFHPNYCPYLRVRTRTTLAHAPPLIHPPWRDPPVSSYGPATLRCHLSNICKQKMVSVVGGSKMNDSHRCGASFARGCAANLLQVPELYFSATRSRACVSVGETSCHLIYLANFSLDYRK